MASNSNRGVVYLKPGGVEVQKIDFPTFRNRMPTNHYRVVEILASIERSDEQRVGAAA